MTKSPVFIACVVTSVALACSSKTDTTSSSSSGSSGAPDGGGPSGTSGGTSGTTPTGCTVTFGGDAASVTAKGCTQMGPFTSDSTAFEFHGDATGLDAPIYSFTVKYPNGITAKKYETKDIFYISANLGVTATNKNYFVDFDSRDATKERHGSVTTVFTSETHGTIDIVFDSSDPPVTQATVHITF